MDIRKIAERLPEVLRGRSKVEILVLVDFGADLAGYDLDPLRPLLENMTKEQIIMVVTFLSRALLTRLED